MFWIPFCVSLVATLFFMTADEAVGYKLIIAAIFGLSVFLQFLVPISFVVPLVIQCALGIGLLFYFQIGYRL